MTDTFLTKKKFKDFFQIKYYPSMMLDKLFSRNDSRRLFWEWFSKNSKRLYHFEKNQSFLFHRLKVELDKIDPNLVFEFSPILENGKREFVISADGMKSSFNSVEKLVESAPKNSMWDIIAFRQPKPTTNKFYYEDLEVRFEDIYFSATNENGKLGLDLYIKNFTESAEWTNLTFLLLDYVLGEYDTEMYISWVEKHPYKTQENLQLISTLPELVNQHKIKLLN